VLPLCFVLSFVGVLLQSYPHHVNMGKLIAFIRSINTAEKNQHNLSSSTALQTFRSSPLNFVMHSD
jgi:hypothetical protein